MGKALLVVDVLNEFMYGEIAGESPADIVPVLLRLIQSAREYSVPVIFCKDEHLSVDRELAIWGEHAMKGSQGAEIIKQIAVDDDDFVVPKRTYSGFFDTGLDSLLRDLKATTLYVTGLYADPCVRHTVADAYMRRYDIVVVSDAVATLNPGSLTEELEYMQRMYGARIATAREVTVELAQPARLATQISLGV
jgi:nicotinamidase-related amidase